MPVKNYTLADKLRNEFSGRGAAVSGMRASSTEELIRMAERADDPDFNCAEMAFKKNYKEQHYHSQDPSRPPSSGKETQNQAQNQTPRRSSANSAAASANTRHEIRVSSAKFPVFVPFLLLTLVSIVTVLCIGISDVYRMTSEVNSLENQLESLKAEASDLEVLIEEKKDLRNIDNLARTELGMTKEDTLNRKKISISEGEHITIEIQEEESASPDGVLLSSIWSALNRFFDKFK